jgi:hypothetical protein
MTDETITTPEIEEKSNVIPLFPDELPAVKVGKDEVEMTEYVFTNDKNNPMIRQLFRMFYYSMLENKLGLMHARKKGTNKVHTIIVGVEETEEGTITWPIAKILTEEEHSLYLAPDGNGGFIGDEDEDDSALEHE